MTLIQQWNKIMKFLLSHLKTLPLNFINQWKKYVGVEQDHGEKTLKTIFSSFVLLTATKMCVLLRSHRSNKHNYPHFMIACKYQL